MIQSDLSSAWMNNPYRCTPMCENQFRHNQGAQKNTITSTSVMEPPMPFSEPPGQWRRVTITETRTRKDWAHQLQQLLDVDYPDAEKVVLVCDNLNTHVPGSFYEAFHPTVAQALLSRLEIHYTPKHGSWLNIAEIELSALTRQCLNRRIPTIDVLKTKNKCLEPATQPIPEGC